MPFREQVIFAAGSSVIGELSVSQEKKREKKVARLSAVSGVLCFNQKKQKAFYCFVGGEWCVYVFNIFFW